MANAPSELPNFLIPRMEVSIDEGETGLIGSGALGEVRRGEWKGNIVALKSLHLLRSDESARARLGGEINPRERKFLTEKFMQECTFMKDFSHTV